MAKLKKCLSELNGLLSQEEEKFLIKTEEDSQIGNDVQAANFAITQYYKQLHDKLNDLKTKVGLPAMPYPDFVLANEAVPKTEYKPKLPSEKQVASAKKAMRYKEAEKAFSLIGRYKSLSRAAKRGSVGSAIMSAIRDEVARINADILLTSRGVKVIEKDGSVVSKPPARSSADFVSMQNERKQILKDALNAEPDTLEYAVIQDIANGAVFSLESFKKYTKLKGKEIDAAPSYLINDNPNSKKLDLYTRNEGIFAIDEKSSAELIAETLQNYFTKNARERAAIDLVAMYEDRFLEKKEQGRSKEELKELELLELENEELLKAVEDIEAEIAEMAKKDLDAQELMEAEQRDILEQDKMNDELIKLLNIGYARESAQAQVNKEIDARVDRGELSPKELLNKSYFFQKKNETKGAEIIDKVVAVIKKALPKVAIEFDDNLVDDDGLPAAGRVKGNVITINRNYASNDTPIHEAGHILIDAIGYNNKVIQSAIAELKKTPLWKETKEAYRELSEEMLGKEVLAEAIGREGAGIFETESQKSKFKAMLSYIFDRIKRLLGIEKNVAKSLAKQIIAGIGTKDLVGTTAQAQMAKRKVLSDAQAQVKELVDAIAENEDLSSIPYEELLDVYNAINAQDIPGKSKYLRDVKIRIGMNIFEREKTKLQKNKDFSADRAATKDLNAKEVKFKVLSHFIDAYPEFKSLSEMWDAAYFAKIKESREGKNTNEKLAIEVIKDRNSRLGITQRAIEMVQSLFTSVNYKYFSFLDNGKGKLVTLSEAKKKGYSKAQIEYLKFVRDLIASRKILMDSDDIYNMDMEVLKLDKGFSEAFKTDGLAQAFGNWLSSSDGLRETQIEFKNPITGKTSITSYQNAETALVKYGEKGPKEKAQSIALILKYNFAARRKKSDAENKQRGTYYLDENGQLKSKFDRKRPPEASYSTDFYKAVSEYIDDNAHITHISPLMPVIESIEYLNKRGVYEFDDDGNKTPIHAKKPNVVKWINEWRDLHVLRQKDEGIPELDASLKFLRFLTSATTMMFNIPAGLMNIAIGNYNAWRTGNTEMVAKGNARLFGGKKKFKSDYGYGLINPIAVDIARKYNAVSTDIDSNPIQTLSGIMSKLGHAITKYGEFQIQASGLLGLMSDEDFNSFEYRKNKFGVDELVFKKNVPPQKQLEIESRILKHINTVSDIQGKYSEKDRRNIQNNELGKALMQFKVYLPDYWRMRFGKDVGSWYIMLNGGLKELKKDIKDNGLKKGLWDNESREAKAFMSNLKGTAAVALFMILSHSDDDDDEGAVAFAEKMLSNLLGIFDPVQLKFTLTRPIAAMGVVDRFLTAVEHLSLWSEDAYMKSDSKYGEKGDAKILNDIKGLIPGRKVADALDMFSEDEE